jgi:L-lactate dehydrogenase complex protein LldG
MSAKQEIRGRIRASLSDLPPDEVPVPRDYRRSGATGAEVADLFVERVEDYRARVLRCDAGGVARVVASACSERAAQSLVVPPGLPRDWRPGDLELVEDDGFSPKDLDGFDGVITGAALGIAETGTIVLAGEASQGRRALSLVPDFHVCVVAVSDLVASVPQAVERLLDAIRERRPLSFISGPSATSDIELERVEGVHGPRTLDVVLFG